MKKDYFPNGFRYPDGFPYSDANPDPVMEAVKERMAFLNEIYGVSALPGHVLAAALSLLQRESGKDVDAFWQIAMKNMSAEELAVVAKALSCHVEQEPPRLDFPNAIALFDCRFISTAEWEHIRRYSIGGSEVAAVLGKSKYASAATVFLEKRHPCPARYSIDRQHILDYGHAVEPYIVSEVAHRLGATVYPEYRMFAHKDYPFLTCNPDGILQFPDGRLTLFEAKTAFWLKMQDWRDGIPEYYAPQPRHYLEVMDDPRLADGYIAVCCGGLPKDIRCHSYQRDKAAGTEQTALLLDFWRNHIAPDIPPALSGNPDIDHAAVYDYRTEEVRDAETVLPPELEAQFQEYFRLVSDAKRTRKMRFWKKSVSGFPRILPLQSIPADRLIG